ncbi:virion morphogenesis protein [Pseudomonas putida]|uniref:phage virion morphogenesis protein n=1 Tax=Pseudomonas putida TaxID=303 RepID=UPI0007DBF99B|nr:phage virion morphogenesis protein [Pseudomonas putida]OAS04015.1 virion morphogenesis protein [Pseudomonas putida]
MASRLFDLDARGVLGVREQLALLQLEPRLRRRLLNNVSKRVRTMSRQRIRSQQNLDGSPFAARKNPEPGQKKMESGLGKLIQVTSLTPDQAVLGWKNNLTSWVAAQQHNGTSERRTAQQMRRWNKVSEGSMATDRQAKRLRRLGFKVRQEGKKRLSRPSVSWILEHVSYMQAGVLIRVLDETRGESTGADSWEIQLPKRQFLGANTTRDTSLLVNQVLQQILNSPR